MSRSSKITHSAQALWLLATCAAVPSYTVAEGEQHLHHHANATITGHEHHAASSSPMTKGYVRSLHAYTTPPVTLIGADNEPVTLASLLDTNKPVLLNFIFTTCPTVCPVLTATFSQIQNRLGADAQGLRMISISIDPEHDTPDRLREYAERYGAGSQWRFLTGSTEDILAVQKAFDAYRGNKMNHEPFTFFRSSPGDSWIRFDGFMSSTDLLTEFRHASR